MFIAFVCIIEHIFRETLQPLYFCAFELSEGESTFSRERRGRGGGGHNLIPVIFFNKKDSLRMKNELAPLSTEVTQRRTELVSIQSDIQV